MVELVQRCQVKLTNLECCGEGVTPFARRTGETLHALRARLLAMDGLHDTRGGEGKVARYEAEMARGVAFPPLFVIALGGHLMLDDGSHRCTAAAVSGAEALSAVLITVATREQADRVSALLFDLEAAGASWQAREGIIAAMLETQAVRAA